MQRIAVLAAVLATLLTAPAVHAQGSWGNIKGRIVWGPKEIPERTEIVAVKTNADKNHCLKDGPVLSEQWVVNKKTRGLQWTFIWLINDDPKDKADIPIHPKLQAVPTDSPSVDQPVCAFIPHSLAMREGQTLVAKNTSPVSHNIKWTSAKNMGNVTLPAGAEFKLKELVAERLPMIIECNIHPWMKGYVGIFKHPYYALTDADGNFEIKDAPAGKYRIVIWNNAYNGGAPGRFGQQVAIPAGKTAQLGDIEFMPPKE
jgi:hypothetical protein